MADRDYKWAAELRESGFTWEYIAEQTGFPSANAARKSIKRYLKRQNGSEPTISPETEIAEGRIIQKWVKLEDGSTVHIKMPDAVVEESEVRAAFEEYKADVLTHAPDYEVVEPATGLGGDDDEGVLFELAIHDPHFGMLAWHREVGGTSYDLNIAVEDYGAAVEHLLPYAMLYNTERILYTVGHDMQHVNQTGQNKSGGVTARGTAQDVDGRIAKIFTTIRRAAVRGIDMARLIAPVDVMVVPGNHDPDEMYKLGEVLNAWYRLDDRVNIIYGPSKRSFYNFGANTFMFTHGETYARQRDSLPLIMADECPADWWVASTGSLGCREIHTGHNHRAMEGGYYPTAEMTESRGIRTRSLPGLTATDSWHHEEGYRHKRAATALVYRKPGGIVGLHEFNL